MSVLWICKNFDELGTRELYAILQLRNEVFIVEQNCVYQDIDHKDLKSYHLMAFEGDNLVAYCRVIPPGLSYEEASIGRVVTAPLSRGKGIGITLIEKAVVEAYRTFETQKIRISAQLYLKRFYESFGFKQTSEVYLEDDIEHIEMLLSA